MKKEYLVPEMEIVKMQTMSVLAQSLNQNGQQDASTDEGGNYYNNQLAPGLFDDGGDW